MLRDVDKMPFGKFKGRAMMDVPASYLHWLWHEGKKDDKDEIAEYIRNNKGALMKETPNLIWD